MKKHLKQWLNGSPTAWSCCGWRHGFGIQYSLIFCSSSCDFLGGNHFRKTHVYCNFSRTSMNLNNQDILESSLSQRSSGNELWAIQKKTYIKEKDIDQCFGEKMVRPVDGSMRLLKYSEIQQIFEEFGFNEKTKAKDTPQRPQRPVWIYCKLWMVLQENIE